MSSFSFSGMTGVCSVKSEGKNTWNASLWPSLHLNLELYGEEGEKVREEGKESEEKNEEVKTQY